MTVEGRDRTMPAVGLRKEWQKCSLGCPILDRTLNGGIPCKSITELVGESSTAKTQLCLQLVLTVQLPIGKGGLNGSALYIYTENYFASSRLQQLSAAQSIAARAERRRLFASEPPTSARDNNVTLATGADDFVRTPRKDDERNRRKCFRLSFENVRLQDGYSDTYKVCEPPAKIPTIDPDECTTRIGGAVDPSKNVYVQALHSPDELLGYLDRAELLLSHPLRMPVRLLVVDSIAGLFRSAFGAKASLKERGNIFFQVSSKLKQLAEKYDLAVVVTNHVTDYFEAAEANRRDPAPGSAPGSVGSDALMTSGRRVVPSLGISWAHCVNTRLFLSRLNYGNNMIRRSMQVVFAPHLPNVSCDFVVDGDGVQGLPKRSLEDWQDSGEELDYHYSVDGVPLATFVASSNSA